MKLNSAVSTAFRPDNEKPLKRLNVICRPGHRAKATVLMGVLNASALLKKARVLARREVQPLGWLMNRRSFINASAMAAGGLALPAMALADEEAVLSTKPKLRLGFDNFSV